MPTLTGSRDSNLLSNIFVLLGCAILGLSLTGNFLNGQRSAFTGEGEWFQAGQALILDCALAAFALYIGRLVSQRKFLSATFYGFIAALFGFASAYSLINFQLSEQVNKTRTASVNSEQQAVVARTNYEAKKEGWDGYLATLDANIAATKDPAQKATLIVERREAVKSTPELTAPQIDSAMVDPSSEVMAGYAKRAGLSLKTEDFQVGRIIFVVILTVLGKAFFFGIAGATREKEPPPLTSALTYKRHQTRKFAETHTRKDRLLRRTISDDLVEDYLREATFLLPENKISGAQFHQHFCQWAKASGRDVVTPAHFGRSLSRYRARNKTFDRTSNGYNVLYVGVGLKALPAKESAFSENVTRLPLSTERRVA